MVESYPLHWPSGYPRSKSDKYGRFKTTPAVARDYVKKEIQRIGGTNPIISSNVPVKQNGDLYANWTSYKIQDHGVAVYFTLNNQQICLCCDTYNKFYFNLYAVGRTLAALRQIDRDGVSDFLNRAFVGFKALPASNKKPWWEILGCSKTDTMDYINSRYRQLAKQYHADAGSDNHEQMVLINEAYEQAKKEKK